MPPGHASPACRPGAVDESIIPTAGINAGLTRYPPRQRRREYFVLNQNKTFCCMFILPIRACRSSKPPGRILAVSRLAIIMPGQRRICPTVFCIRRSDAMNGVEQRMT
jgi:hypothetical protein